jgi:hypothetical protein
MKTLQDELSKFNSKTCDYEKFKEYIKKKNEVNAKLFAEYENKLFRKLKWYSYINRQRSDSLLLNRIEKKYGKDAIIIYGDWSFSSHLKYMSTPGISLKRKIARRFKVYNLDEFRTSCLDYKTEQRCENLSLPDKKGILRSQHAILSFTNEHNQEGYRNRDRNSVNGFKKITRSILQTGERPMRYRRGYELPIPPDITIKKSNSKKATNDRSADCQMKE